MPDMIVLGALIVVVLIIGYFAVRDAGRRGAQSGERIVSRIVELNRRPWREFDAALDAALDEEDTGA